MDVDEQDSTKHVLVISNLPGRDRDEEDVSSMLYVGMSIPANELQYKSITRATSNTNKPGNVLIEFNTLEQKINVLKRKRRLQYTNEYSDVYIRNLKSRSEVITEQNFVSLLNVLPQHHKLKMNSNGRIMKRTSGPVYQSA